MALGFPHYENFTHIFIIGVFPYSIRSDCVETWLYTCICNHFGGLPEKEWRTTISMYRVLPCSAVSKALGLWVNSPFAWWNWWTHPITPAGPKPMFLAWRIGNGRRGSTGDLKGRKNDGSFGAGEGSGRLRNWRIHWNQPRNLDFELENAWKLRFQWQKWGCFGPPVAGDGFEISGAAKPFLCQEWCSLTGGLSLLTLQVLELKMGPGHLRTV